MKKSIFVILLVCIFSSVNVYGQSKADIELFGDQVDTTTNMVWISASFAYQLPFGSLKETFKSNMNLGADLTYKNKKNWTFSLDFNYLFGAKIRDQRAVVGDNMLTVNGDLIDGNGLKATVYFEGRYWNIGAGVGKIIPFGKWRNSGLWLKLNGGYFEHKIRIHDPDNQIPQLADDYKKGYDQRCNGFCLTQFVGYVFMQKVRVASFYADSKSLKSGLKAVAITTSHLWEKTKPRNSVCSSDRNLAGLFPFSKKEKFKPCIDTNFFFS